MLRDAVTSPTEVAVIGSTRLTRATARGTGTVLVAPSATRPSRPASIPVTELEDG